MRPHLRVRITAADVGERVTVRSRTGAPDGEPSTTDTVGYLRSWSGGVLRVQRRDGSVREIDEADIVAGKVLGPPVVRRPRVESGQTPKGEVPRDDDAPTADPKGSGGHA